MPPPMVTVGPPTCSDRMKAGFFIGLSVGVTIGGFFGGSAAFKQGLKGAELIRYAGKTMIQVGGSFGTFMAIGVALRC